MTEMCTQEQHHLAILTNRGIERMTGIDMMIVNIVNCTMLKTVMVVWEDPKWYINTIDIK